mmetsp:Transcript_29654/g.33047  ORF Transcript_29654/g.33047 Transcript_29654/m.33047 type:complete len:522 (+) Transcript_29654:269-1834(+)
MLYTLFSTTSGGTYDNQSESYIERMVVELDTVCAISSLSQEEKMAIESYTTEDTSYSDEKQLRRQTRSQHSLERQTQDFSSKRISGFILNKTDAIRVIPSPLPQCHEWRRFDLFDELYYDVKLCVFSLLDIRDLAVCRGVSLNFRECVSAHIFYRKHAQMDARLCQYRARKAKEITGSLEDKIEMTMRNSQEGRETYSTRLPDKGPKALANQKARIGYLKATLEATEMLLLSVAKSTPESLWNKYPVKTTQCFQRLVQVLSGNIEDTTTTLEQIARDEMDISPNFDIYELTLRRYYDQLKRMFIEADDHTLHEPSTLIADEQARLLWTELFGQGRYFVKFDQFCSQVIQPLVSSHSREIDASYEDLIASLKFFVNFPRDDLVTPYKFHLLCCHWGPYSKIACNLEKYALCNGFVGLVNAIHSKHILSEISTQNNGKTYVLMRFSRLHPDKLTISYMSPNREVRHYRKPVNMTVEDLFAQKLGLGSTDIEFIPRRLDWLKIERRTTLRAFASYMGHYVQTPT